MTSAPSHFEKTLLAVDIGNSRIKLGLFSGDASTAPLPVPMQTLELPLENRDGDFDAPPLEAWCEANLKGDATWWISSVHSGAAVRWLGAVRRIAKQQDYNWSLRPIANDNVPMTIEVDFPERVGTDRLMAAIAANRLRRADRAAIIIDLGTAIKVDVVTRAGAFAGGAILPGLAMSARALEEQTDTLPRVAVDQWRAPPPALGKSTEPAIEAGLFWGAVGAIRELVEHYANEFGPSPDLFASGGASQLVAGVLSQRHGLRVVHVPHLVLGGIALLGSESPGGVHHGGSLTGG
ncbi:MAG TPA: type III pantothenate kinase [Lacipirellulaceae bacterium]